GQDVRTGQLALAAYGVKRGAALGVPSAQNAVHIPHGAVVFGPQDRLGNDLGRKAALLKPAVDRAALPPGEIGRVDAEPAGDLLPAFGAQGLTLKILFSVGPGFNAGFAPAVQFPADRSDCLAGIAWLAGNLGAAGQNHIGLPALVEIERDEAQHLAAAQRTAKAR